MSTDAGLDRPLIKNIYKYRKTRKGEVISRKQIGVMVAGALEGGDVSFGFSLCHPDYDTFDWVPNASGGLSRQKNFGRELALSRAVKWGRSNKPQFIPYKIRSEASDFINRAERYYKDRNIMQWVEQSLNDPVEREL